MAEPATADGWRAILEPTAWMAEGAIMLAALSAAGSAVRDLYDRAAAATYAKSDGSPVTDADLAADRTIRSILADRFPRDAVLTEEGQDDAARLGNPRCWIVDPIDGTQQFVERTGNFDILIALTVEGRPVVAGALQPPNGIVCLAVAGGGAWVARDRRPPERIRLAADPPESPAVGTSTWFGAPDNLGVVAGVAHRIGGRAVGASRIGFTPRNFIAPRWCDVLLGCRIGANQSMAHEWDIAVGDLFLDEAGGVLTDLDGEPCRYNRQQPFFRRGLVAAIAPALHARALAATRVELAARAVPGF